MSVGVATFGNVELRLFDETSFTCRIVGSRLTLNFDNFQLVFFRNSEVIKEIKIGPNVTVSRFSPRVVGIVTELEKSEKSFCSYFVEFAMAKDVITFMNCAGSRDSRGTRLPTEMGVSTFDKRTDPWSAVQYFQFYSYLSQQQNMMQDYIRTSTYQRAILSNATTDFRGKVVLDVGAGSGILSFFAIQAGATKVYAVEASNMATHCNILVQANKLAGRIVVISGKIEDITLPEPVDIIISEPMGYMLYNERMLETYVHARKFLAPHLKQSSRYATNAVPNGPRQRNKSEELLDGDGAHDSCHSGTSEDEQSREAMQDGMTDPSDEDVVGDNGQISHRAIQSPGIMFPTVANLYIVPFSDEALFAEQFAKANFWYQQNFHGMDLTALRNAAVAEYFNQPVVDTFDIGLCPALPCVHKVDFRTVSEAQLATINIPLHFQISTCSTIHGLAFWFDVGFLGSQRDVWLSTAPTEPLTHWYQVRCLLGTPLFVQEGQSLNGHVTMQANSRQSYDVQIELIVPGSQTKITNNLDLKNPHFRYNGYPPAPPPGSHTRSPTEVYYANLCLQQQQHHQQQNAVQVQTVPGGGWTVPIASPIDSAPGGNSFNINSNPIFSTTAMAHPNLFSINNVTIPAEFRQQSTQQQSMQLSPQPPLSAPPSVLSTLLPAVPPPSNSVALAAGNTPFACVAAAAAGLGSSAFFSPTSSLMSGVIEEGNSYTSREHPNGWRSNAFTID